ncbi:MAG TPA: FtsX-like permease family protein [Vineibacter sp.]|nr:FtsX-like permease family protein [Vineibacter sp.]
MTPPALVLPRANAARRIGSGGGGSWALAARIALRELRTGLAGFRLFLACLALGVAAIAAILSMSRAVEEGLRADARLLLGGDVAVTQSYRPATPEQRAAFGERAAKVADWIEMRGMARAETPGARPALVQIKAVDAAYPLAGKLELAGGGELQALLRPRDGLPGAVVEEIGLRRLGASIGDRIRVGDATFEVRATIAREPDRGLGIFGIGPRLMIARDALPATGLVQPGSLMTYEYRVLLPEGTSYRTWIGELRRRFPEAGWRLRGLNEAGSGVRTWVNRLTQYLALIGLAALLVGGVGVGNAVDSFLRARARTIAILKCLGAPAALITRTYFLQLAILALAGVALGLVVGALLPFVAQLALGDLLPVRARVALYAQPLASAALFGLLVALLFALWPLARARQVPASTLMRGAVATDEPPLRLRDAALILLVVVLLAGLTVLLAPDRRVAGWFVAGAIGAFIAFPLLARLVMWLARLAGRPRSAVLRLALANIHRPGSPTPTVMLSLGLGLTVLVATALIEGNLQNQIGQRLPKDAPAFFVVDLQPDQVEPFRALLRQRDVPRVEQVPMLRGRISKIAGTPVRELAIPPHARWSVESDRGLTYAATLPEGSQVVAGKWWPANYQGKALISFDVELARAFGVGVGDTITVNILGRDVDAEIANLRKIDWGTLGINFTFIFAPGTLEKAPQTFLATVYAKGAAEEAAYRAITDAFPNITVVRVKDALETAAQILGNIGLAARVVGVVGIVAGLLVLAGAMLATQRRRVHDTVVMKVLGATRGRVLSVYAYEFAALGLVTALAATAVGSVAAWLVVRNVMNLDWTFQPDVAVITAFGAMALTLAFGLAGAIVALRQRPLGLLRNE